MRMKKASGMIRKNKVELRVRVNLAGVRDESRSGFFLQFLFQNNMSSSFKKRV